MRALSALRHAGGGLFNALAELGNARMAPPRDPREAAHRLAGALGAVGRAHDLVVTVRGSVPRGAALLVANHVSFLDPLAILPICPALPIVRGEVMSWPVVGPIGAALGVVFVRDRVRALRRIHSLLAAGVPVLDFPDVNGGFARGTFGIAQRTGVPVVPIAIRYRDPIAATSYVHSIGRASIEVELVFGAPMPPRVGEAAEDFALRARNANTRNLAALSASNSNARAGR